MKKYFKENKLNRNLFLLLNCSAYPKLLIYRDQRLYYKSSSCIYQSYRLFKFEMNLKSNLKTKGRLYNIFIIN